MAHALAPLLQTNETRLAQRLTPVLRHTNNGGRLTNSYRRYVCLKRVPVETWAKIRAAMTNLSFGVDEKSCPRGSSVLSSAKAKRCECGVCV